MSVHAAMAVVEIAPYSRRKRRRTSGVSFTGVRSRRGEPVGPQATRIG
jgi:hypothetical protein